VNVKFLLCKLNEERFHNSINIIVGIYHFFRKKEIPYDFACIHCINYYGHVQECHELHGILELHAILVSASQPDSSRIVPTVCIVLTGYSHMRLGVFNSNLDNNTSLGVLPLKVQCCPSSLQLVTFLIFSVQH